MPTEQNFDKEIYPSDIQNSPTRLLPVSMNPGLDDYSNAQDKEAFLENEKKVIAERLKNLPVGDNFSDTREDVLERHTLLLDALSEKYKLDFRTVARTRMQRLGGVMGPQTALIQLMFDKNVESEETGGETFFASRIQVEGVQLNATSITYIEGFPFAFSVLKREGKDEFGPYGVDYPALSFPREVLSALNMWKEHQNPGSKLEDDTLTKETVEQFDERVHDIIHALFLYDTRAQTKIFQNFSKEIFFTKHIYSDPNKINYEFMVDKMFYDGWQKVFEKHPDVKEKILNKADNFLQRVDEFESYLNAKDSDKTDYNKRIANFVAFVALRGLTHKFDYMGPEFKELAKKHPRVERVVDLLPENIKEYLHGIYSETVGSKFPFGEDEKEVPLGEILKNYTTSLLEEFRLSVVEARNGNWEVTANAYNLLKLLPESITSQLAKTEQKKEDPKCIVRLYRMLENIKDAYGEGAYGQVAKRIEVDSETGFYFRIKPNEVDFSEKGNFAEILHSKNGLLVQIPYDYPKETVEISLLRPKTLLQSEKGAVAYAKPGDIVLVNVQDKDLAEKVLGLSSPEGVFDFDLFKKVLSKETERGESSFGDVYPYPLEGAIETFDLKAKGVLREEDGKVFLESGFYSSKKSKRKAYGVGGPVSFNEEGPGLRRVQYGAVALSNVLKDGKPDIFPIDQASLGKFYSGVKRTDLPKIHFIDGFGRDLGLAESVDTSIFVQEVLQELENINTIKVYGPRGDVPGITFERSLT